MTVAKREFPAMGTTCSVSVYGSGDSGRRGRTLEWLATLGEQRVMLLEALWSRFRQDSELSRLRAFAGQAAMSVSKETETLVRAMQSAWQVTGGAFDPTVLDAVKVVGYDRDFAEVIAADCIAAPSVFHGSIPGMSEVAVGERSVSLPMGVSLDPGAIGKGLAADMVVEELLLAGAHGVIVDLGGDIALGGVPGTDSMWSIGVSDERSPGRQPATARRHVSWKPGIGHAAIATSTTLKRRWADSRHHIVDPRTGSSTDETIVQATIAGARAWECEAWATAVLVRPSLLEVLPRGMTALVLAPGEVLRDDFSHDSETKVA